MTLSEIEFVSRTRNAATSCVLPAYNAAKRDCVRGALPQTPLGELTALPHTPYLVLRGPFRGGEGKGKGGKGLKEREGKGKAGEGQGGRGRGVEGRLTLTRSCNRAADSLRPALQTRVGSIHELGRVGSDPIVCELGWAIVGVLR